MTEIVRASAPEPKRTGEYNHQTVQSASATYDSLGPPQRQDILSASCHPRAEPLSFSIEKIFKPLGIDFRGTVHPKAPDLSRYHPQGEKVARPGVHIREVHQAEIPAEIFVTFDSLIIVEKIAAAIENEAFLVHLNCLDMV